MSFFTSLSENRETLFIENPANAFWKLGHFFSITFQLRPAVKSDLVIRSKYSSSFFGGLAFQLGDTCIPESVYIFMDFEFQTAFTKPFSTLRAIQAVFISNVRNK